MNIHSIKFKIYRTLLCTSCRICLTINVNKHLSHLTSGRAPTKGGNSVVSRNLHIGPVVLEKTECEKVYRPTDGRTTSDQKRPGELKEGNLFTYKPITIISVFSILSKYRENTYYCRLFQGAHGTVQIYCDIQLHKFIYLEIRYLFRVALGYEHAVGHVIKSYYVRFSFSRFDQIPTACSYPNVTQKSILFLIFILIYGITGFP